MSRSDARIAAFGLLAAVVILVVGYLASLIAGAIPPETGTVNVFLDNLQSIPVVLARTAPWAALLEIVCVIWVWIANRLFRRWNETMVCEQSNSCGRGLVHEIAHDNNAAASLLVLMPLLILGVMLVYESILNK